MRYCSMCNDYGNNGFSELEKIYTSEKKRLIWSDSIFKILPTIGCFLEGYSLIITQKHIPCLAALSDDELKQLDVLVDYVSNLFRSTYGSILFFEHGMMDNFQRAGGCIDHAHLHCFPKFVNVAKFLISNYQFREIGSMSDLRYYYESCIPYILISSESGIFFVAEAKSMRSQLLREIVGFNIGEPNRWDWRKHYFLENMNNTYTHLFPIFKSELNYTTSKSKIMEDSIPINRTTI